MFNWNKDMRCLDLPAQLVLRLQRSLTEVQVALPGVEPQEANAYVCAYVEGKGVRVAVILHCLADSFLAFYLNDDGEVGQQDCARVFNLGIDFAETMGFLMADTDIHTLQNGERITLWNNLPLKDGVAPSVSEALELESEADVLEPEELSPMEEVNSSDQADFTTLKPVEAEAAEAKAAEAKAAEAKAAEAKAAEAKAAEAKAAEAKAAEGRERSDVEKIGRLLASF